MLKQPERQLTSVERHLADGICHHCGEKAVGCLGCARGGCCGHSPECAENPKHRVKVSFDITFPPAENAASMGGVKNA